MRFVVAFVAAVVALSTGDEVWADDATVEAPGPSVEASVALTGFEIGARVGFSLPAGGLSERSTALVNGQSVSGPGQQLSNLYSGRVPLMLDAGYRILSNVYVGAFFAYGILLINSDTNGNTAGTAFGCNAGVSCSAHEFDLGAEVHFHAIPGGPADPWLGLGFGYEWTTIDLSQADQSASASIPGLQFVNAQAGLDLKPEPRSAVGPFLMLSVGQYDSLVTSSGGVKQTVDFPSKALHEWVTFGLRGVYDVKL